MKGLDVMLADEPVSLLPGRAAFLHRSLTLLVADLHLGRQEAWRASGLPVGARAASASIEESIARLDGLVQSTGARRVLVLGDLLHAPSGLSPDMIDRFAQWRREVPVPMQLVPGNHDRRPDIVLRPWDLEVRPPLVFEGNFGFTHDASLCERTPGDGRLLWCGHVHPMVRLSTRGDAVRLACFWISGGTALLPAFSGMSSGATVRTAPGDLVYAIADTEILDVSCAATKPDGRAPVRGASRPRR